MNPRLFTAVEKAKKESVTRDTIERAVKKDAGTGDEKLVMEHVVFEGCAPKSFPELTGAQRAGAGEFPQTPDGHDDAHRVWAAVK